MEVNLEAEVGSLMNGMSTGESEVEEKVKEEVVRALDRVSCRALEGNNLELKNVEPRGIGSGRCHPLRTFCFTDTSLRERGSSSRDPPGSHTPKNARCASDQDRHQLSLDQPVGWG